MKNESIPVTVDVKVHPRFDSNDWTYYGGLLMLGLGLAFGVSWQTALIVIGAVLATVSVANAYVLTILASRMTRKD